MQDSSGLILSMPTPIKHRTASQTERKPSLALGRSPLIPLPTLHVAFLRLANLPSYPLDLCACDLQPRGDPGGAHSATKSASPSFAASVGVAPS
jgi:hypothetical protein